MSASVGAAWPPWPGPCRRPWSGGPRPSRAREHPLGQPRAAAPRCRRPAGRRRRRGRTPPRRRRRGRSTGTSAASVVDVADHPRDVAHAVVPAVRLAVAGHDVVERGRARPGSSPTATVQAARSSASSPIAAQSSRRRERVGARLAATRWPCSSTNRGGGSAGRGGATSSATRRSTSCTTSPGPGHPAAGVPGRPLRHPRGAPPGDGRRRCRGGREPRARAPAAGGRAAPEPGPAAGPRRLTSPAVITTATAAPRRAGRAGTGAWPRSAVAADDEPLEELDAERRRRCSLASSQRSSSPGSGPPPGRIEATTRLPRVRRRRSTRPSARRRRGPSRARRCRRRRRSVRPRRSSSRTRATVSCGRDGAWPGRRRRGRRRRVDRVDAGAGRSVGATELDMDPPPEGSAGEGDVGGGDVTEGVSQRVGLELADGRPGEAARRDDGRRPAPATSTIADGDRRALGDERPSAATRAGSPSRAPGGERRHPAVRAVGEVAGRPEHQREQRRQPEPGDEQPGAGERTGTGAVAAMTHADARPARRRPGGSGRGPKRSVTRSPTTRPTSIPPATATKPSPACPAVRSKRSLISSADQSFGGSSARAIAMPTRNSATRTRRGWRRGAVRRRRRPPGPALVVAVGEQEARRDEREHGEHDARDERVGRATRCRRPRRGWRRCRR